LSVSDNQLPIKAATRHLLATITCWRKGHQPDAEDLDWVGRPCRCARCGRYDAEMSWPAYERFCGKAAIIAWNTQADGLASQIEILP